DRVSGTGISDSRLQHRLQTFFATRRKLSGRNEKRSASSGSPEPRPRNPKQEGKYIMKSRNIQFKATALRCKNTGLLLACFAAVFISAPTPAAARDMVPFNGTVSGYVESQSGTECEPSLHVVNFGNANQLGAFTGTAEFFPRPCEPDPDLCENNIPYTGTFDWFAANGDEISGTFEGYLCPTETPGVYDNHETAEVTGGTGRVANATGRCELGGQLDFTT